MTSAMKKNSLAPSKCTVYISNLPFSLTNCDLFKVYEKYGKIIRVTIVKDKETRKSKGVAFLLFQERDGALACVNATHGQEMFGRTLKANIAKDNGRAAEFIRRREYPDKSRCYECREIGHLSYNCPSNLLGIRERPPKKKRKHKLKKDPQNFPLEEDASENDSEVNEEDFGDSLGAAIRYQQELREGEDFLHGQKRANDNECNVPLKRRLIQSSYFSDEDDLSE